MNIMSEVLVKHFLSLQPIARSIIDDMGVVKSDNAHISLLNTYNIPWTYEILNDYYSKDDKEYYVTITLYLPGMIRPGVGVSKVVADRDYKFEAIAIAIKNACQTMRIGYKVVKETEIPTPTSTPLPRLEPVSNDNYGDNNYSVSQLNKLIEFKNLNSIKDDKTFVKYLTAWNKDITTLIQLNPKNIDSFLDWTKYIETTVI